MPEKKDEIINNQDFEKNFEENQKNTDDELELDIDVDSGDVNVSVTKTWNF